MESLTFIKIRSTDTRIITRFEHRTRVLLIFERVCFVMYDEV